MNRAERRRVARDIVKKSPGLLEKIADEEGVPLGRARQLAVTYIAQGLAAQELFAGAEWTDADEPALD